MTRRIVLLMAVMLIALVGMSMRGKGTRQARAQAVQATCCHKATGQCYRVMVGSGCFEGDTEVADCAECGGK